jgi:type IV fimbrial biogenesis protein FimT
MPRGLSLLEIMLTMGISSILFGFAVPGVANLISQNRIAAQVNTLRSSLELTRSVAIQANQHTVICKSADGKECSRRGSWDQGWIVFVDDNHDRYHSADERLVQVHAPLPGGTQLKYRAFGSRHYVTYRPIGFTKTNGTFTFCNPAVPNRSRALILTKSGRVRLSTTLPGGRPIECENGG